MAKYEVLSTGARTHYLVKPGVDGPTFIGLPFRSRRAAQAAADAANAR